MSKSPPPADYDDNPEWTEEMFARARPADEVLPAEVAASLVKNKGGRPAGSNKEQVALRLDRDVLAHFRADGPGWQTRINAALRKNLSQKYLVREDGGQFVVVDKRMWDADNPEAMRSLAGVATFVAGPFATREEAEKAVPSTDRPDQASPGG